MSDTVDSSQGSAPPAGAPVPPTAPPSTSAPPPPPTPPLPKESACEHETLFVRYPLLLPALMIGGAAIGLLIGGIYASSWKTPEFAPVRGFFKLLGSVLMNSLKAMVVPLILFSVVCSVSKLGDLRKAGRMFGITLLYFAVTMTLAASLGLALVNTIKPGVGQHYEIQSAEEKARADKAKTTDASASSRLYGVISDMFPDNLVDAMARGQVLGIIIFALIAGFTLGAMGSRAGPLLENCEILYEMFLRIIFLIIWFAPIGIMGLMAERIGSLGGLEAIKAELARLFWYALTVVVGLLIHGGIVLPLILWLIAGRNPIRYLLNMSDALLCAFGTASSGATLPLTLRCLEFKNKVSKKTIGVVVPLGATVNMNGTALYEAVAVLFIAQSYGMQLDFSAQLIVLITSVLAAVGAAAIPEAGLVTMVIVLVAANLPVEGAALVISIDWLLDRCRTTVNVWDDCVGAAVVERWGNNPAELKTSA